MRFLAKNQRKCQTKSRLLSRFLGPLDGLDGLQKLRDVRAAFGDSLDPAETLLSATKEWTHCIVECMSKHSEKATVDHFKVVSLFNLKRLAPKLHSYLRIGGDSKGVPRYAITPDIRQTVSPVIFNEMHTVARKVASLRVFALVDKGKFFKYLL